MNRKKSREIAMEILFQMLINKEDSKETFESFKENTDYDLEDLDLSYIENIIEGVEKSQEQLDEIIESHLQNWKLNRISKVDLCILRLASYEIVHEDDIPDKVAVNEAIELAKKYSDPSSVSFINGVLDKIIKK